jgi:hypothetical protein
MLAACAPISQQAKDDLAKPVNCETAQADIAALEAEKTSVAEQAAAGVRSVVPAAAVGGLLMGTTKDKAKVATGAYNKELEAKIAEIKVTCGL